MSLFDKIFKSSQDIAKDEINEIPWHPLTRMEQLEEIEKESHKKTVVIFKHSTRCGISKMVLRNFERDFAATSEKELKLYFLDLLSNREISNEIASRFGVQHESPQLLILKEGKVVQHDSHHGIKAESLAEYI